jgi:hypothetical protein
MEAACSRDSETANVLDRLSLYQISHISPEQPLFPTPQKTAASSLGFENNAR